MKYYISLIIVKKINKKDVDSYRHLIGVIIYVDYMYRLDQSRYGLYILTWLRVR
jgi:hypothetical protein